MVSTTLNDVIMANPNQAAQEAARRAERAADEARKRAKEADEAARRARQAK